MAKESKHATTSESSRRLCDLLFGCLPHDEAPSRNHTATWCGVHVRKRKAAIYWVLHSKDHLQVFLTCEDKPENRSDISNLLPAGVMLHSRPLPHKGSWAMGTPLFIYIETENQARSMGPLLQFLSSSRTNSKSAGDKSKHAYWSSNSEESVQAPENVSEGSKVLVLVSRYERSKKNRTLCIQAYGALCYVCGFDFSKTYGEIGKGYIHVHHLTPLATLKGKSRKINPVRDLRPVCPNCHEMLHQSNPPRTIDQLRESIHIAKAALHRSSL